MAASRASTRLQPAQSELSDTSTTRIHPGRRACAVRPAQGRLIGPAAARLPSPALPQQRALSHGLAGQLGARGQVPPAGHQRRHRATSVSMAAPGRPCREQWAPSSTASSDQCQRTGGVAPARVAALLAPALGLQQNMHSIQSSVSDGGATEANGAPQGPRPTTT